MKKTIYWGKLILFVSFLLAVVCSSVLNVMAETNKKLTFVATMEVDGYRILEVDRAGGGYDTTELKDVKQHLSAGDIFEIDYEDMPAFIKRKADSKVWQYEHYYQIEGYYEDAIGDSFFYDIYHPEMMLDMGLADVPLAPVSDGGYLVDIYTVDEGQPGFDIFQIDTIKAQGKIEKIVVPNTGNYYVRLRGALYNKESAALENVGGHVTVSLGTGVVSDGSLNYTEQKIYVQLLQDSGRLLNPVEWLEMLEAKPPFIQDGYVMISAEQLLSAVYDHVTWNQNTKTALCYPENIVDDLLYGVSFRLKSDKIVFDSDSITVHGKTTKMAAPAIEKDGVMYVPIRSISEALGYPIVDVEQKDGYIVITIDVGEGKSIF